MLAGEEKRPTGSSGERIQLVNGGARVQIPALTVLCWASAEFPLSPLAPEPRGRIWLRVNVFVYFQRPLKTNSPSLEPAAKNDLLNEVESSSSTQTGSTDGTVSLFNITVPRTVLLSLSKKTYAKHHNKLLHHTHTNMCVFYSWLQRTTVLILIYLGVNLQICYLISVSVINN